MQSLRWQSDFSAVARRIHTVMSPVGCLGLRCCHCCSCRQCSSTCRCLRSRCSSLRRCTHLSSFKTPLTSGRYVYPTVTLGHAATADTCVCGRHSVGSCAGRAAVLSLADPVPEIDICLVTQVTACPRPHSIQYATENIGRAIHSTDHAYYAYISGMPATLIFNLQSW